MAGSNAHVFQCNFVYSKQLVGDPTWGCEQTEGVKVTEDGEKAMMNLSGGDMRRVLNILQSCSMAFDEVNEDNVYTCVGHPLKSGLATKIYSVGFLLLGVRNPPHTPLFGTTKTSAVSTNAHAIFASSVLKRYLGTCLVCHFLIEKLIQKASIKNELVARIGSHQISPTWSTGC